MAFGPGSRSSTPLRRLPEQITVLDIVDAIEGPEPAFRWREVRQRGPVGDDPGNHAGRSAIASTFDTAGLAWRDQLASQTIADLLVAMHREAPRVALQTRVTQRGR